MISEEAFFELPKCNRCKNRGWYTVRCDTEELQDEHGVPPGEPVQIKCSACRVQRRRREMFLENKSFQNSISFYELDDYCLPDERLPGYKPTVEALSIIRSFCDDIESLVLFGGFVLLRGKPNSGKTVFAHMLARQTYLAGYLANYISILDLNIDLSYDIKGTVSYDPDGKVVFDLDDYLEPPVLIVDDFDMINEYFCYANLRRALILRIFRDRIRSGKTTLVLSRDSIEDLFSREKRQVKGFPYDFPPVVDKRAKVLKLHGKFKKEKA